MDIPLSDPLVVLVLWKISRLAVLILMQYIIVLPTFVPVYF